MCTDYTSSPLDNRMQGEHFEDFYLMRYADVLLMLTELTGEASYMNIKMSGERCLHAS